MGRPRQTAVVTDSTVSLPPNLTSDLGLVVVPLEVAVGDQAYRNGVDITAGDLYRVLRQGGRPPPKTSAPGLGSFLEAFQKAAAEATSVLCLTLTSRLSSVCDSARTAAHLFRDQRPDIEVRVLDSGTAAGAQALLAIMAARRARDGASLAEVEETIHRLKGRVHMLALMDTLYYVGKGGHVPRVAAWAGDLLQVKPILEMVPGGEVRMVERPRTRRRALERLLDLTRARVGTAPVFMNVLHADALEEAQALRARVEREFLCTQTLLTEFSPVIGAHTGPGLVGLAFLPSPDA